jgi:hypothetical protein
MVETCCSKKQCVILAITVARLNAVIVDSKPTQGMDVCVCVVVCVGSGLATG